MGRAVERNGKGWRERLAETLRAARAAAAPAAGGVLQPLGRRGRLTLSLLGTFFFAGALSILDYGAPPLVLREGERARANVYARVDFRYDDPTAYNQAREEARTKTPEVYIQEPRWTEWARADADKLVETRRKSKDLEEFGKTVAELKLVADAKLAEPLWNELGAIANPQAELLDPLTEVLKRLEDRGILSDARYGADSLRRVERRSKARPEEPGRDFISAAYCFSQAQAAREIAKSVDLEFPHLRGKKLPEVLKALLAERVRQQPSLVHNPELSAAARKAAEAEVDRDKLVQQRQKGAPLLNAGDKIGEAEKAILRAENQACWEQAAPADHLARKIGLAAIILLLLGVTCAWLARVEPEIFRNPRQLVLLGLLGLGVLAAARSAPEKDLPAGAVPVVFFAMVGALVFSARSAAALSALVSALAVAAQGGNFFDGAALAAGAVAGALANANPRHRLDVLKAALVAGLVTALSAAAGRLLSGGVDPADFLAPAGWALLAALAQGLVVAGALPVLEWAFGATTNISLRELCDQNHPLLQSLFLSAPGSYQHSMVVGMLSETAAEAVGARALLARAGSYFHDIGKVARPEYFVENAPPGEDRHDRLSPAMSAMVLISHVRDGVTLAREHRLPRAVVGIIEQHHGTTLAEFFYRRAAERGEPVAESVYRYGGPRPQSREAAIVFLADAVEAASRALEEPSVARIRAMVHEIIRRRLLEGQFDECGLTFRELAVVEDTFARILSSMFHARVAYPAANGSSRR